MMEPRNPIMQSFGGWLNCKPIRGAGVRVEPKLYHVMNCCGEGCKKKAGRGLGANRKLSQTEKKKADPDPI